VALVLGLGNPGERYALTRHNVGFRVLDELARRHGVRATERTPEYVARETEVRERRLALVAPLTFMNRSGDALATWLERHAAEETVLLVVVDDVYLPVGTVRLKAQGSSGGHRGLEAIEMALGSREYDRLRIGVGAGISADLRRHVLEAPSSEEAKAIEEAIRVAADAVECWLGEGILAAMNRFNRSAGKEVSES